MDPFQFVGHPHTLIQFTKLFHEKVQEKRHNFIKISIYFINYRNDLYFVRFFTKQRKHFQK